MKDLTRLGFALVLTSTVSCTKPAEESSPEPAPRAEGSSELAAEGRSEPAPGSEPAPAGAFVVRLGDVQASVDVRLPDSRFERNGDGLRLYLYGDEGWGLVTSIPAQDGTHDLASLGSTLTDPEVTDHALSAGTLNIDAIDPASGRLAFTIRGQTAEGAAVTVDVDTTVTPLR